MATAIKSCDLSRLSPAAFISAATPKTRRLAKPRTTVAPGLVKVEGAAAPKGDASPLGGAVVEWPICSLLAMPKVQYEETLRGLSGWESAKKRQNVKQTFHVLALCRDALGSTDFPEWLAGLGLADDMECLFAAVAAVVLHPPEGKVRQSTMTPIAFCTLKQILKGFAGQPGEISVPHLRKWLPATVSCNLNAGWDHGLCPDCAPQGASERKGTSPELCAQPDGPS